MQFTLRTDTRRMLPSTLQNLPNATLLLYSVSEFLEPAVHDALCGYGYNRCCINFGIPSAIPTYISVPVCIRILNA